MLKKVIKLTGRVTALTLLYAFIVTLISVIMMLAGITFPDMGTDQSTSLYQLIFSGFVISLFIVFLTGKYTDTGRWSFFVILFNILFLSNLSVAIEGRLFTPGIITNQTLKVLIIQQFLIAIIFSLLATLFIKKRYPVTQSTEGGKRRRPDLVFLWVILGATVYMISYYLLGLLNYTLFTKPYYDLGISGLAVPEGNILIFIILSRGTLITLTVVPFILLVQPGNIIKMWEPGLILFLFGGLLPLSMTVTLFPLRFTLFSLAEIFLQNFLTGLIIYNIFNYQVTRAKPRQKYGR